MLLITVHLQYVDAANNTKPTNANFFQKKNQMVLERPIK